MTAGQRIDKWLWMARIAKTRTLAAKRVTNGTVRINNVRIVKPSKLVETGDIITLVHGDQLRIFEVSGLGERRGPFEEARQLYKDLTPPDSLRSSSRKHRIMSPAQREKGSGRPTKKQRRDMTNWTARET